MGPSVNIAVNISTLYMVVCLFVFWWTVCIPFSWIIIKPNSNATQRLVYGHRACVARHEVQVSIRFGINITGHVCHPASFCLVTKSTILVTLLRVTLFWILLLKSPMAVHGKLNMNNRIKCSHHLAVFTHIFFFLCVVQILWWYCETLQQRSLRQFYYESCARPATSHVITSPLLSVTDLLWCVCLYEMIIFIQMEQFSK